MRKVLIYYLNEKRVPAKESTPRGADRNHIIILGLMETWHNLKLYAAARTDKQSQSADNQEHQQSHPQTVHQPEPTVSQPFLALFGCDVSP